MRLTRMLLSVTALVSACGGDDDEPGGTDVVASGFAPEGGNDDASTGGTTPNGTDSDPSDGGSNASETDGPPPPPETLLGILTFSLYPADPLNDEDILGFAGAWRAPTDDWSGWGNIDDFFAISLAATYPATPVEPDTLVQSAGFNDFDWGVPGDWLLAGTSMKLETAETEAHACVLFRGGAPTVVFPPGPSGVNTPNYPIYMSTPSANQPEGCAPNPSTWQSDTAYDLVLYGGDLFPNNILAGSVHTPVAFEVGAPDLDAYQEPLSSAEDLAITWSPVGSEGERVVIRVIDQFDRLFTIHAADDGEYTVPAAELQVLSQGFVTFMIARERIEDVAFTKGSVKVVTRIERWGYFDLI